MECDLEHGIRIHISFTILELYTNTWELYVTSLFSCACCVGGFDRVCFRFNGCTDPFMEKCFNHYVVLLYLSICTTFISIEFLSHLTPCAQSRWIIRRLYLWSWQFVEIPKPYWNCYWLYQCDEKRSLQFSSCCKVQIFVRFVAPRGISLRRRRRTERSSALGLYWGQLSAGRLSSQWTEALEEGSDRSPRVLIASPGDAF